MCYLSHRYIFSFLPSHGFLSQGDKITFRCPDSFELLADGRVAANKLTLTCRPDGMWDHRKPKCRVTYNSRLDDQFGRAKPMGLADDTWWATRMETYVESVGKPRHKQREFKKERNQHLNHLFDDHLSPEARANEKMNQLDYEA